jgi:hypothetical protein
MPTLALSQEGVALPRLSSPTDASAMGQGSAQYVSLGTAHTRVALNGDIHLRSPPRRRHVVLVVPLTLIAQSLQLNNTLQQNVTELSQAGTGPVDKAARRKRLR